MPITCPITLRAITQDEFAQLDYHVMRHAFDSQNALGRLCDEVIYQNDLAARIRKVDLDPVRTEVPITVSHGDFSKVYSLDLVVGDGAIYELKAVSAFAPEHEAQLLNYLCLANARHGKLVNFRTAQVESSFVNTRLTHEKRSRIVLHTQHWHENDDRSALVRKTLCALLDDWGAFLEVPLYLDALVHFLGGEDRVLTTIPLSRDGIALGSQRIHLLTPEIGFRVTAMTDAVENYESQLRSLLRHSSLHTILWINLAHHDIHFVSVRR